MEAKETEPPTQFPIPVVDPKCSLPSARVCPVGSRVGKPPRSLLLCRLLGIERDWESVLLQIQRQMQTGDSRPDNANSFHLRMLLSTRGQSKELPQSTRKRHELSAEKDEGGIRFAASSHLHDAPDDAGMVTARRDRVEDAFKRCQHAPRGGDSRFEPIGSSSLRTCQAQDVQTGGRDALDRRQANGR